MKVGILSMQRVKNYGSFLQAFAIKQTAISFGNEVEFIDTLPGIQIPECKLTLKKRFNDLIKRYFNFYMLQHRRFVLAYLKIFPEYLQELEIDKHTFDSFDVVIIGSDEVFNIAQITPWGYSSQLFGNILNAKKVISYGGSFGQTDMEFLKKNNLIEDVTVALKKMSAISVRDNNSKEIVSILLNRIPFVNIDPVLFFDFSQYIRETKERGYILIYSYPNRINDRKIVDAIKLLAQKNKKKIYSIFSFYEWADIVLLPHPFEVLAYFKNADYVITDTFHGAVMSIKYNKQFAVLIRDSNKNKLVSLLRMLKLETQIAENSFDIRDVILHPIDYSDTNKIIKEETRKALSYLEEYLKYD